MSDKQLFKEKNFKLKPEEIKTLIAPMGYSICSDQITVEGKKVGYMYREEPYDHEDSGWRFLAGDETEEYITDPENCEVYAVNTVANYDPDIIPFLNNPYNSFFERNELGEFIRLDEEDINWDEEDQA